MIRIAASQYSLVSKSFEIYLSGCSADPHCENCHNPELWSFDIGEPYTDEIKTKFLTKIEQYDDLIDSIWILGGEPLDQPIDELEVLFKDLYQANKDIWLFTRNDIEEVPVNISQYCSYVKCGRHIPSKHEDGYSMFGVDLSSTNQKIYKMPKFVDDDDVINDWGNSTVEMPD